MMKQRMECRKSVNPALAAHWDFLAGLEALSVTGYFPLILWCLNSLISSLLTNSPAPASRYLYHRSSVRPSVLWPFRRIWLQKTSEVVLWQFTELVRWLSGPRYWLLSLKPEFKPWDSWWMDGEAHAHLHKTEKQFPNSTFH